MMDVLSSFRSRYRSMHGWQMLATIARLWLLEMQDNNSLQTEGKVSAWLWRMSYNLQPNFHLRHNAPSTGLAEPSGTVIRLCPFCLAILVFICAVEVWFLTLLDFFPTHLDSARFRRHSMVFRIIHRGINSDGLMQTIPTYQLVMKQDSCVSYLIAVVEYREHRTPPVCYRRPRENYKAGRSTSEIFLQLINK